MTPWPPLITTGKMQRWMVWRDRIATTLLWLLFLYLVVDQSIALWKNIHRVELEHPGALLEHWHFRLKPFGMLVLIFFLWLLLFGLLSLRHWRRVTGEAAPAPLPIEIEARHRGTDVERIIEARVMKVATILIDDGGRFAAGPKAQT